LVNLKIFRLAADSIREANNLARAQEESDTDVFALMRHSAKTRLSLFKEYPWIYKLVYRRWWFCPNREVLRRESTWF
jgi:TetR/AcrR family transcriptional regulator